MIPALYSTNTVPERPPLPLRFAIYRMDNTKAMNDTVSKHPFFLYALKECLVGLSSLAQTLNVLETLTLGLGQLC